MPNSIAFARNYVSVIDEVYQGAGVSGVLNSGRRMVRAGHNAKEVMLPKISVTGLGNYTRNVGYKTGAITYEFETKTFNYDCGIRLFADVMDVEEAGVNDCFVEAGAELMRTQVAPEANAFTFAQIAGHTGVTVETENLSGVTSANQMFTSCSSLETIYATSFSNTGLSGSLMLNSCNRLVGGTDGFVPSTTSSASVCKLGAGGVLTDPNNDNRTWFWAHYYANGEGVLTVSSARPYARARGVRADLCHRQVRGPGLHALGRRHRADAPPAPHERDLRDRQEEVMGQ